MAGPQPDPPGLQIAMEDGKLVFSWAVPVKPFVLESKENLGDQEWSPVNQAPTTVNGQEQIRLPAGSERKFFRLRLTQ